MEMKDSYILNGDSFNIRELCHAKDQKLFNEIVEHENKVFGEGSVGKWNIKPFAKYGKVFVVLKKGVNYFNQKNFKEKENSETFNRVEKSTASEELVSVIEVLRGFDVETAYGLFNET